MREKKKEIRLLVVDHECKDDFDGYYEQFREIAELCSHIFNITCKFTESGKEALSLINTWEPSIVMVDAHLEDLSGFDIVKRGNEYHVPVVMTSDHRIFELEESAKISGASAYLPKVEGPEEFEGLMHKIAFIAGELSSKH